MTPAKAGTNEPIDAVYTWTGGDPLILRSSLRSLGKHAPWIRKVYVVTGAQAPAWLAGEHPRLALVKQEELFRDRSAAASPSPDAVAWLIYRIPGLSRQFLYLDSHLLLGRRLALADFLTPKNGNRFFVEDSDISAGSSAEKLLNSRFGDRSPRKKPAPTPRFIDKNFLEEVNRLWERNIKAGGVSFETLYFYYLVECPQQYGIHEKVAMTPGMLQTAPLSDAKQVAGLLLGRPQFFSLEGETLPLGSKLALQLYYWRRSPFEK